jgi:hypothetical protein
MTYFQLIFPSQIIEKFSHKIEADADDGEANQDK